MTTKHALSILDQIEVQHRKEIRLTQTELLKGVPREGGLFTRKILLAMIKSAFLGGAVSEREAKQKPSKN